jgi:predicted dehydrogenase
MTYAIIGLGRWGKNLMQEFSKLEEISYCYTKGNQKNIRWLKKNFPKVKYVDSLMPIFMDTKINSVIIATPIQSHYSLSLSALKHGKNVFVEKPLGTTLRQCTSLIKVAKKQNLKLFVGHIFLYHPVFIKIKKLIQNDPIVYFDSSWEKYGTFNEDIGLNLLTHQFSIITSLLGIPQKIILHKQSSKLLEKNLVCLDMKFKKNIQARVLTNRLSSKKRFLITILTKNNVYIWENNELYKFDKIKKTFKLFFRSKITPLEIECREFVNYINGNFTLFNNTKQALTAIKLLKQTTLQKI